MRQLLARRSKVRREQLGDKTGAAADLKKLHDLSPTDHTVMEELSALLTELGDYRGLVQLYEDQILRGKDMNARAELARKVARMWEEQLQDPREAADAWRRVLRMKAGDTEAQAGLERAKTNMLKKPDPSAGASAYAPPKFVGARFRLAARRSAFRRSSPASRFRPPRRPPPVAASRLAPLPARGRRPRCAPRRRRITTATPPDTDDATGPQKPERPNDLFFRSSPDEVTLSAPSSLKRNMMEQSPDTLEEPDTEKPKSLPPAHRRRRRRGRAGEDGPGHGARLPQLRRSLRRGCRRSPSRPRARRAVIPAPPRR